MIHNFERAFSDRTISDRSALLGRRVGSLLCNKATLAITVLNRILAEHELQQSLLLAKDAALIALLRSLVMRFSLSSDSLSAHEVE
jgi:hypothetical protein